MKYLKPTRIVLGVIIAHIFTSCAVSPKAESTAPPAMASQPSDSQALTQIRQLQMQSSPEMGFDYGGMATISIDSVDHFVQWNTGPENCFLGSVPNREDTLEDYFLGFSEGVSKVDSGKWTMELLIPKQAAESGASLWNHRVESDWIFRVHNSTVHGFSTPQAPLFLQIDDWNKQTHLVTGRLSGVLDDALSDHNIWVKSLFFRVNWCLDSLYKRMER